MMSKDQVQIVNEMYSKFMESEHEDSWDDLDDALAHLDYLTNVEVMNETTILFDKHVNGNIRCKLNHPQSKCVAPKIAEAVLAIIQLYRETGVLHVKNRYICSYYLALTHTKFIIVD